MDQDLQKQLEELRRKHQEVIQKKNAELDAIKELSVAPETVQQTTISSNHGSSKKVTLSMTEPKETVELKPKEEIKIEKFTKSTQSEQIETDPLQNENSENYTQNAVIEIDEKSQMAFDYTNEGDDLNFQTYHSLSSSEFTKIWNEKAESRYCATDCQWRGRELLVTYKTNLKNRSGYILKRDINSLSSATKYECPSQPTSITCVPRSNDLFVVGGNTGLLFLYDTREKSNPVAQTQRWNACHTCQIIGQVFVSDRRLISVAADGSIYLWELDNLAAPIKQELHMSQYKSQGSRPTAVTSTDIGNLLVGFEDGSIFTKGTKGTKDEERILKYGGPITGIDFRPGFKGQRSSFVVSSLDGVTEVVSNGKTLKKVESLTESFVGCVWQPQTVRQCFCACRSDGLVSLYDVDGENGTELSYNLESIATCCRFSSDGRHLCVGTIDENVSVLTCPLNGSD